MDKALHVTADNETPGTVSAAQRVYDRLRGQIIALELPPGAVLSRTELVDRFGVSQTPIREALQRLEAEGLVRIFPQSRTVVRRIDVRQLYETHFFRVAVECEVVRRLTAAPQPEVVSRARAILQMQKALAGDLAQMDLFNDLDRNFHQALYRGMGVGALQELVASRLGHLARCQRLELPKAGKMENIVNAHAAILDAIATGNPEAADAAMRFHLSGTIGRVGDLRAEWPDYFTGDALPFP
ncbi:MAG: GntR family transcriptional regulator [Pseudooceanicola sp.]|nr:GntR family transcriptional regulator [Pseudooceanicola sp.]